MEVEWGHFEYDMFQKSRFGGHSKEASRKNEGIQPGHISQALLPRRFQIRQNDNIQEQKRPQIGENRTIS